MSSSGPIDLVLKTYELSSCPDRRPSRRKTSVHDINESIREDLIKRIGEIHLDFSLWKCHFESIDCCSLEIPSSSSSIRLNEWKENLLREMKELIDKFCQQAEKRGSIHPSMEKNRLKVEHFVSLIEYLRNELMKMKYLFNSRLDKEIVDLEEQSEVLSERYLFDVPNCDSFVGHSLNTKGVDCCSLL